MDDISRNDAAALGAAWRGLRGRSGLRVRDVACVGAPRTMLLIEIGPATHPLVVLSAAVHGDEPAGAWALFAAVRDGLLDPRFGYRIWPCLNPSGFARGTRANAEGIDVNRSFAGAGSSPESRAVLAVNRDRRFALTIDLHEDHEADGFYLYETTMPPVRSRYAAAVTGAVREAGFPLQRFDASFELGPAGSETAQTRGLGTVLVDAAAEAPFYGRELPAGLAVVRRAAPCAVTFETPLRRSLDERIAMHRVALVAALRRAAV